MSYNGCVPPSVPTDPVTDLCMVFECCLGCLYLGLVLRQINSCLSRLYLRPAYTQPGSTTPLSIGFCFLRPRLLAAGKARCRGLAAKDALLGYPGMVCP